MELWDVYDANRNLTGKTMTRGTFFQRGEYHLAVHVCIFHSDGRMLIQQRQPFKKDWSNLWDVTIGGSAVMGETSRLAAERELLEELGLKIDLSGIRPHMTINFKYGFDDIYLVQTDIDIQTLHLQYEEVQGVMWASREDIFQMIDRGEFIPYHKTLIHLFFEMRDQYGSHNLLDE